MLTRRRFSRYYLKMISENQRERYAMFSQNTFEILFFDFVLFSSQKCYIVYTRVHIRDGMRITVCNTFLFLMISETYGMLCTVNKIGEIRFSHVGWIESRLYNKSLILRKIQPTERDRRICKFILIWTLRIRTQNRVRIHCVQIMYKNGFDDVSESNLIVIL